MAKASFNSKGGGSGGAKGGGGGFKRSGGAVRARGIGGVKGTRNDPAVKARERMAKRAKRAKFWKENKKRIGYAFLAFLALTYLALFTPFGPDYYYNKLQAEQWEGPNKLKAGYIRGLYKLGWFYGVTFREKEARERFNDIGKLAYGFTFDDYSSNPSKWLDLAAENELNRGRGLYTGPPVEVPAEDRIFVGWGIRGVADILMRENRRQFAGRLYVDLFMQDFLEKYPEIEDVDPKLVTHMRNTGKRMTGQ